MAENVQGLETLSNGQWLLGCTFESFKLIFTFIFINMPNIHIHTFTCIGIIRRYIRCYNTCIYIEVLIVPGYCHLSTHIVATVGKL